MPDVIPTTVCVARLAVAEQCSRQLD